MGSNKLFIVLAILIMPMIGVGAIQLEQDTNSVEEIETSLISRIKPYKHAGLSIDELHSGYVLTLYSPDQFSANIASRNEAKEGYKQLNEKLESLRQKRADAIKNGATTQEANAITHKMNSLPRPDSTFLKSILLHNVICTGTDYVELNPVDQDESTVLIPIERICRVELTKTDTLK